MEYKTTRENKKIPAVLYGTAWKKENTTRLVTQALQNQFCGIDTAGQPKHYQEDLVGLGLLEAYKLGVKREDLFIQTKFTPIDGQDPNKLPYTKDASLTQQIKESFENSKKNLHTQYIDSYILHSPIFPGQRLLEAWSAMETFYNLGEIGDLGISNCYDLDVLQYLYNNASIKPSIVQNRFYAHTNYDKELRAWCMENKIVYQSFWSLTANINILSDEIIINLSKKYQKTQAQIFYRFLHQIDIIPLIGTTSIEHMHDDIAIFTFELDKNEINQISCLLGL